MGHAERNMSDPEELDGRLLLVGHDGDCPDLVSHMWAAAAGFRSQTDASWPVLESTASVAEACDRLASARYTLVLLELGLPDTASYRDAIRDLRQRSDAPVIVITEGQSGDLALECIRFGADDVLLKESLSPQVLSRTAVLALQRCRWRAASGDKTHRSSALGDGEGNESASAIVVVSETGDVLDANPVACRMLGKARSALAGHSLYDCLEARMAEEGSPALSVTRLNDGSWNGQNVHVLQLTE